MSATIYRLWICASCCFLLFLIPYTCPAQPLEGSIAPDPMLATLQQMVAKNPGRSDNWRLLGKIHRKRKETADALFAFRKSLELQPDNIAAHADFGDYLLELGDNRAADFHFDEVMKLGAETKYGKELVSRGIRRPPSRLATADLQVDDASLPDEVQPASYDIQSFDGADDLQRRLNELESDTKVELNRFRAFVETGVLYNTNVSLTPISRELTGDEQASFQGFFSPDVEWLAINNGVLRSGPLMRGYFTVNEDNFSDLDLASFQPGAFVERDLPQWGDSLLIGRVDYVYALDLLGGDRFGDRHSLTSSLTTILPSLDVIYSYFTTSYSNFANDGADPAVDSLDGLTLTAGSSRFFQTDWDLLPKTSLGADLEWADTTGSDYRYLGVTFHTDATFQLTERLAFIPRLGIGYRDYYAFTGTVNRDEVTFRIGGKLKWQLNESLFLSAVVGYDRFACENEDFDSSRTEGGLVLTWLK